MIVRLETGDTAPVAAVQERPSGIGPPGMRVARPSIDRILQHAVQAHLTADHRGRRDAGVGHLHGLRQGTMRVVEDRPAKRRDDLEHVALAHTDGACAHLWKLPTDYSSNSMFTSALIAAPE